MPELLPNEEVYLETRPLRGLYARKGWVMSVPGIPLFLMTILLEYFISVVPLHPSLPGGTRLILLLCGLPFIALTLFFAFGHYLLYYLEAKSVRYVITDRRIIIRRGRVIHKDFEIFLDRIAGLDVIHQGGKNSPGTIRFLSERATGSPFYMRKFPTGKFRGEVRYTIEAVKDVERVRQIIERIIDPAHRENA